MVELAIAGNPAFAVDPGSSSSAAVRHTPSTRWRPTRLGSPRRVDRRGSSCRPRRSGGCRPGASPAGAASWRGSRSRHATATRPPAPSLVAEHFPAWRPRRVPGRAAPAPVGNGDPGSSRRRTIDPVSGPGCGPDVYRGSWAVSSTPGGPAIVTEPAMPRPPPTAGLRRAPTAAQARQGRAGRPAPGARDCASRGRARRGQEGGRHRPAGSRRA